MKIVSTTLDEYKKEYKIRLELHKNKYDDNWDDSFFEIELNHYRNYYNSLKKITAFVKSAPKNNLGHYPITHDVGSDLKIINEAVFNEIISVKKADPEHEEYEFRNLLYPGSNPPSIEIDMENLNNRITSAKRILDFLKKKHSDASNSIVLEEESKDAVTSTVVDTISQSEAKQVGLDEHIRSTIENHLGTLANYINPNHYKVLADALYIYFTKGKFPKLKDKIMFKRVNKKMVGWVLKEVYVNIKTEKLSVEYFQFAKDYINVFSEEIIDKTSFRKSRFYKYFTTNPLK